MARVSIDVIAESEDIAALVGLGGEISSALDRWIAHSESLKVTIDHASIEYANVIKVKVEETNG
jgi:hypothetical protein